MAPTTRIDVTSWEIERLDLDAYLRRVGLTARTPGRDALDELHEAHVRTFPFEWVDVVLGQHAGVDLGAIQSKFLGPRSRGGYCFEHASLFAAVLERLGYDVTRHLGRVGSPDSPRTHMTVVVHIDGEDRFADPGFGRSILRTMPLVDGTVLDDGFRYRLVRVSDPEPAWVLERDHDGTWEFLHVTDEAVVRPVDVLTGHHLTSTHPRSHFRTSFGAARHGDDGHLALSARAVTRRRHGQPTQRHEAAPDEVMAILPEIGVELSDDEATRLRALLPTLES